ncbi:MAG TPA: S8 family serine peptidase [Myxococcaceae bacterium]|nr:S8 family serine peptidase [Myxococcaceae bacterium]
MATTTDLARNIRIATADQRITREEWQSLMQPIADGTAKRATAESRQILNVWANDRYQIDPQVRGWMQGFLNSRGYGVPSERPAGVSGTSLANRIAAENVGEVDAAFQKVANAAGRAQASVNVGVIDNGFDMWHPELGPKGWVNPAEVAGNGIDEDRNGKTDDSHGWDFVDWNNDVGTPNGDWHGTHVAGIATKGTDQIDVVPMRVIHSPYDIHKVAAAVDYAAANGVKVINMSFGFDTPERVQVMKDVMARHPNVLFVAACGNDNRSLDSYDKNRFLAANDLPNLVVVAASDATGNKADFSNYGPQATLAARGADVLSTIPGSRYERMSGTSMAAPEVVNASAKCLLLDPGLRPTQLKQLLTDTTDTKASWAGKVASGGVINPERAFKLAGLTGLMRGGKTAEAAAEQLGLRGSERTRLIALAAKYVAGASPRAVA